MNEKQRILQMVQDGKISAEEGFNLLEKIEEDVENFNVTCKKFSTLKIRIKDEKDKIDINLNLPLSMIKMLGGFVKYIPEEILEKTKKRGIDLKEIDLRFVISEIEKGIKEDPYIVNIKIDNEKEGKILVEIYLD